MAIDIRGLGNEEALSQIAKLAYGSGRFEKTSGGKGNIGLLDGRAVKFNTHFRERGGTTTEGMLLSCNELRRRLSEIATAMLSAEEGVDPAAQQRRNAALEDVRRRLGMDADGVNVTSTRLLDRAVVASVINVIRDAMGFDAWRGIGGAGAKALSSKGVDTTFVSVTRDVRLTDDVRRQVREAVAAIANPADGRPGVVLNEEATKFLADLVERDLRDPNRRAALDLDEVARGIREFTSPHLAVTLQAFNLCSNVLATARLELRADEQAGVFLSGSPAGQRADRADVAVSLFADASPDYHGADSCLAMALVSEKMPEMRRIQPDGRLTGATVWMACFGERVPRGAAGGLWSQEFSDAFFKRLRRLGDDVLAKSGGLRMFPGMKFSKEPGLFLQRASAGMGFTAAIRLTAQDPAYRLDAERDFVAAPPLYAVQDALVKVDEDLVEQIGKDFYRDTPVVRLHDGQDVETFDFDAILADAQRQTRDVPEARRSIEARRMLDGKVGELVASLDARFGGRMTGVQRKLLLIGLMQAALMPFAPLAQIKDSAHTKMTMDVRREEDGTFVIGYATDRERQDELDVRYEYRIKPDGTNRRGDEFAYAVSFD